jgi:hypothetical protein
MKVTDQEKMQVNRLEKSASIVNLAESVLRGLDEETISKLLAAFLYLKSNGHPDGDFAKFIGKKELWGTLAIGLNVMGAFVPAILFDAEFRNLVMKVGINTGSQIGAKVAVKRYSEKAEEQ